MSDYRYILIKTPEDMAKHGPKQKGDQIEYDENAWQDLISTLGKPFHEGCSYRRPIVAGEGFEIVSEVEARKFDGTIEMPGVEFTFGGADWNAAPAPCMCHNILAFRRRVKSEFVPHEMISVGQVKSEWPRWFRDRDSLWQIDGEETGRFFAIDTQEWGYMNWTLKEMNLPSRPDRKEITAAEAAEILARRNPATAIQPAPKGQGADITKLVQADLEARAVMGEKKYGERLKAHNGRNALQDAYQEALDLCCYLRQVIEEGK